MERQTVTAEDSEDETPPVRQPNTIGDPGIESPTAMTNLRRVWNQILWTRLTCTPYITVTDLDDCEQIHPGVLSYVILWLGVSLPDWMQPGTAPTFFLQPTVGTGASVDAGRVSAIAGLGPSDHF